MKRRDVIRVLVIDDSAYSRQTITRMLESSPLVEVVGTAADGEEAIRRSIELEPDLATLDLEMPRMDGFTFLRVLMARKPTPVIVVSGQAGDEQVFKALELGAADFIAKPTPRATPELGTIQDELIRKVHAIRDLRIEKVRARTQAPPTMLGSRISGASRVPRIVVIAASTGGPSALTQILGAFPEAQPYPVLIAQHMPAGFTAGFADRLSRLTPFSASEAQGGEPLEPGRILVAPGGRHLELELSGRQVVTRIVEDLPADKYSPSADRLFASAAKHFGNDVLGVVLTGMGDDGRLGSLAVKEAGGSIIAESEESAVIFGMPKQVIQAGAADQVLALADLPAAMASGGALRSGAVQAPIRKEAE